MISPLDQEKLDAARDELKSVEQNLRAERRVLNRDWNALSPRERSSQSRVIKELEERERTLRETVESFGGL